MIWRKNGRKGVFEYDFDSEELELVFRDASVDVANLLYAPGGDVIGAYSSHGPADYSVFNNLSEEQEANLKLMQGVLGAFPNDDVSIISTSADGTRNIVVARGDRNPGAYYLFDTEELKLRFLVEALPDLPKDALVKMKPVKFEARDGLVIHGLLTVPEAPRG